KNVARYEKGLAARGLTGREGAPLDFPKVCEPDPIWNQLVLRVAGEGRRDALLAHLKEKKVGTEVYYPLPLHRQECFAALGYAEGSLPVSERAAKETLAVPVFPELLPEEIDYVIDALASFFEKPAR